MGDSTANKTDGGSSTNNRVGEQYSQTNALLLLHTRDLSVTLRPRSHWFSVVLTRLFRWESRVLWQRLMSTNLANHLEHVAVVYGADQLESQTASPRYAVDYSECLTEMCLALSAVIGTAKAALSHFESWSWYFIVFASKAWYWFNQ